MITDRLNELRSNSKKMILIFKILKWGAILLSLSSIFLLIWATFLPQQDFYAEKGVAHWSLSVSLFEGSAFSAIIPFSILQPLSLDMFQAKTAFITYFLFRILISFPAFLYGVIQMEKIMLSILNIHTPFSTEIARRLRKISYVIITYALIGNLVINITIAIFVTHIFHINPLNISISGVIVGILILIISHIFFYGTYLQEEFDTTL